MNLKIQESLKARAISTLSVQGNRPGQEDALIVDRDKGIFVMADGFGGPAPGFAAAKSACEAIRNFLFKEAGDRDATFPFVIRTYFSLAGNILFNSLIYANRKIMSANQGKNVHERGGASVLAGYLDGDSLSVANVGNCTAWLLRDQKVADLVVPRTYGSLCDPFLNPLPEELKIPLMALGLCEDLEPEITEFRIKPNDWLVLATDGIPSEFKNQLLNSKQKNLTPDESILEVSHVLNKMIFQDNASISLVIF